jgi:hypothetical protein
MEPATKCPACSAPLDVGATWCPTCGAAAPAPPAPAAPRPVDSVRSAANWALLFALPGLCCLPAGLAGGFFGLRAVERARRDRRPVPVRAVVALLLGAVSLVSSAWLFVSVRSYYLEKRLQRDAVTRRLAGKREAAVLEAQVACDLVEEKLRDRLYDGRDPDQVTCQGPFEAGAGQARLRGVELSFGTRRIPLNACLARAERWFVLGVTAGERCPATPPRVPGASVGFEEEAMRRQATEELEEEEVAAFTAALGRVADGVASSAREKRFCPPVDVASLRTDTQASALQLSTVDLDLLPWRGEPGREWDFLTSEDVRVAVDVRRSTTERAAAVRRIALDGGPYLLAYLSEERAWPVEPRGVSSGRWTGWMVVAALKDGQPICQTRLSFGSPAESRGRTARKRAERAVAELVDHFHDEASDRMAAMSGGQFRLGYRLGR